MTCSVTSCALPAKTRGLCNKHYLRQWKAGTHTAHARRERGGGAIERFWRKVDKSNPSTCWLWTASLNRYGYGQFSVKGTFVLAHRFAYELLVGPIPEGAQLDHVRARGCVHRHCVNPAHLEPVTAQENTLRSDALSAHNARKEGCVNEHGPFDRVDRDGRRRCSACSRERTRRYRERHARVVLRDP